VSATSTYVGLTRADGAATGEPERFSPSGQRTFARVVPADHVQAAALATVMANGCFEAHVVEDASPVGQGLAQLVQREARRRRLDLTGRDTLGDDPEARRSLAARIGRSEADCVLLAAAAPPPQAAALLRELGDVRPGMRFYATAAFADEAFARTVPGTVAPQLRIATPTLAPEAYPAAGRRVLAALRARHGRAPDIRALYGYEALRAVLRAIEDAGDLGNDRAEVVRAFFGMDDRDSVLGTYDIDDNGDITLRVYGLQRIRNGELAFDGVVEPEPA
jgi:branched-chain amino acid transport system substrate-binding protein